ncbi:MAG TPA: T9SS type A sorting domain-containing protein, partial [Chitinophagaceae bacterium]|nr:T9SS type A sorting domain-containing protein [Chitinophagaceae bacterium]
SNWYELGTVAAAGNAGVATKYQFADNKAAAINYYRLRIVDNDGRYIYSNVIVVRAQDINTNISLFPNPAVNNVNITIGRGLAQHGFTLNIINHNGQMVARKQVIDGTSTLSLDVSHLKSGNYTLDILFANGVREAHKLVIAK